MKFWRILGIFGGFLILAGLLGFWFKREIFLNPLADKKDGIEYEGNLVSFGFLPTWMVGKTRTYGSEVSHLIFLGIESDEMGNLIWDTQSNKISNEDYLRQKEKINEFGGKNILGIKLFDDEKLESLLNSEEARNNLIRQIKEVVEENDFDGVNLDFEFQNDQLAILEENFGLFVDELNLENVGEISVDVFANTVIKGDSQRLEKLMSKIDFLVVMAYDFHGAGSDYAGAVAPIGSNIGERNITEVVEACLRGKLDKTKLVMAYPLYGYEWLTETKELGSKIKGSWYQMASWNRVNELVVEKNIEVNWDELSMSPWLVFEDEGEIHQIYFENERSLGIKLDLVKQNQLVGFGFWALGYEGDDQNIWSL